MIPKKVYLSWVTKDIFECPLPIVQEGIVKMRELSPDWDFILHDDADIDAYLKAKCPPEVYEKISATHPVQQGDLWRLMKLYEDGGVYVDIDRLCDTSLNDIAASGARWVLPTCRKYDFSHDFMMTEAGNPAFEIAAQLYMRRLLEGEKSVYFLGPQNYMHAISLYACGQMVNTDPGADQFDLLVSHIKGLGVVDVFEEDPPSMTVLYRGGGSSLDWEAEKRKLYAHYGLQHWTGEW